MFHFYVNFFSPKRYVLYFSFAYSNNWWINEWCWIHIWIYSNDVVARKKMTARKKIRLVKIHFVVLLNSNTFKLEIVIHWRGLLIVIEIENASRNKSRLKYTSNWIEICFGSKICWQCLRLKWNLINFSTNSNEIFLSIRFGAWVHNKFNFERQWNKVWSVFIVRKIDGIFLIAWNAFLESCSAFKLLKRFFFFWRNLKWIVLWAS